jgi:putative membrane protein
MVMNDARKARKLVKAEFDPRIKTYIYITGILIFTVTIVGILLLPLWLIFGRMYINRYFNSLYCELTTRALHFKKGVWFQIERTIPLDKIQDLTFREGPVLRYWGLSTLKVETAGQSAQNSSDMSLIGIIDSRKFREQVLEQRDEITNNQISPTKTQTSLPQDSEMVQLLKEMNQNLKEISSKLER